MSLSALGIYVMFHDIIWGRFGLGNHRSGYSPLWVYYIYLIWHDFQAKMDAPHTLAKLEKLPPGDSES